MKALIVSEFGGPDVLQWREVEDPIPGPGEALVRTGGFAVNWADLMQRQGKYPGGPVPPFPSGHDLMGVVVAHGPGVDTPPIGARVFGVLGHSGAAAEYVSVPTHWLHAAPSTVSDEEAAGLASPFFTADTALVTFGRLQPGDNVLIHAAAGGLGSAAVQLARAYGAATIIATAGSDAKLERVREWGADVLVNYTTDSFVEPTMEATAGRGVDLVVDSVGGDVLGDSFDCLAPLGRLVSVGATSLSSSRRFRLHTLFEKHISVAGFTLGLMMVNQPDILVPGARRVLEQLEKESVRPVVGGVFTAEDAPMAHRFMEDRKSVGRTIVMLSQPETG